MACLLFMEDIYMSLIAVREKFALLSGRHDFVTDFAGGTYTLATGSLADWFINNGQKLLDRKASFAKAYSWYKKDVSAGDKYFMEDIWVSPSREVSVVGYSHEKRMPNLPYGVILSYTCK